MDWTLILLLCTFTTFIVLNSAKEEMVDNNCNITCRRGVLYRYGKVMDCFISLRKNHTNGSVCAITNRHVNPFKAKKKFVRLTLTCKVRITITVDISTDNKWVSVDESPACYVYVIGCTIPIMTLLTFHGLIKVRGIDMDTNSILLAPVFADIPGINHDENSTISTMENVDYLKIHVKTGKCLPIGNLFPNLKVLIIYGFCEGFQTMLSKLTSLHISTMYNNNLTEPVNISKGEKELAMSTLDASLRNFAKNMWTNINPPLLTFPRILSIENNLIADLTHYRFPGDITKLSLKHNILQKFGEKTFQSMHSVLEIDLSHNKLTSFAKESFSNLKSLRSLVLSYNKLRAMQTTFCDGLTSLEHLDVSHNRLVYVQRECFLSMPNLKTLSLQSNHMVEADIPSQLYLQKLEMQNNYIQQLPELSFSSPSLMLLNVSSNSIKKVSIPPDLMVLFNTSYVDLYIDLSYNTVENFSELYPSNLKTDNLFRSIHFDITGNKLNCDCEVKMLRKMLLQSRIGVKLKIGLCNFDDTWTCSSPYHLRNTSLSDVKDSDLNCNYTKQDCPRTCQCFLQSNQSVNVFCGPGKRTRVPNIVPHFTRELHISNNEIEVLEPHLYIRNLTFIDISFNRLSSLDVSVVSLFRNIDLNLRGNKLSTLLHDITKNNIISKIKLADNPLQCDCSNKWLVAWIQRSPDIVLDRHELICHGQFQNLTLISLDISKICPVSLTKSVIIGITFGTGFILLAVVVCVVLYCNRWNLYYYYYMKFRLMLKTFPDEDEDKVYDAFVCYNDENREWMHEIIKRLEHHVPPYKLCISERDFQPGIPVVESIVDNMYNSKRTVLLVTRAFLKDRFCKFAVQTALGRYILTNPKFLVVIVFPGVSVKRVKEHNFSGAFDWIIAFMQSGSYIDAEDPYMWEKLFLAMPKRSKKEPDDDYDGLSCSVSMQDERLPLFQGNSIDCGNTSQGDFVLNHMMSQEIKSL